jgi:DNA repair exonuclease SbcCD ATPase subunit
MRDVAQRAVSFTNHRIVAPNTDLDRTRAGIVKRGLEVVATFAMEEITTLRARKAELQEQREYLRAALKILGGKNRRLEMFATPDPGKWEELHKAETALAAVEKELAELQKQIAYPEQSMEYLEKIMRKSVDLLKVQHQTFRLNWMGVRVENMPDSAGDEITLAEFSLQDEFKRSAVMVRFAIGTAAPS